MVRDNVEENSKYDLVDLFDHYVNKVKLRLETTNVEYHEYASGLTLPSDEFIGDIEPWVYYKSSQQNVAILRLSDFHERINIPNLFGMDELGGDKNGVDVLVQKLAGTYEFLIAWGLDLRRRIVPEAWQPVLWSLSDMQVKNVENLHEMFLNTVVKLPKEVERFIEGRQDFIDIDLNLKFDLDTTILDRFYEAFKSAAGHDF